MGNRRNIKIRTDRKQALVWRSTKLVKLIFLNVFLVAFFYLVYFIDPDTKGAVGAFFILLFGILVILFNTVQHNKRRTYMWSLFIVCFVFLRFLDSGSLINFGILAAAFVSFEFYFIKK